MVVVHLYNLWIGFLDIEDMLVQILYTMYQVKQFKGREHNPSVKEGLLGPITPV